MKVYFDPWLFALIPFQAEQERRLRNDWFIRHRRWFDLDYCQASLEREKEWEDSGRKASWEE